jgi:hypothetical protein
MNKRQRHLPALSWRASLLLLILELSLPFWLCTALNSEKMVLAKLLFGLITAGMLLILILPENPKG